MRVIHGPGILARRGLEAADREWKKPPHRFKGIVLDGIKNAGEIETLRQWPNSYVIAVHAEEDQRYQRLQRREKVKSREEFDIIDRRDSKETGLYGQQVKYCTYLADVIFNNMAEISSEAGTKKASYIRDSVVGKCIGLAEKQKAGLPIHELPPGPDEILMTMAYCISRHSDCIKRKVGALIASREGTVLSSGFNDVPPGQ